MIGAQGDVHGWDHYAVVGALNPKGLDQRRKHQHHLGQGELGADADARADAEGQIREAVGRGAPGRKREGSKASGSRHSRR